MLSDAGEPLDVAVGIAITEYRNAGIAPLPDGVREVGMVIEALRELGAAFLE